MSMGFVEWLSETKLGRGDNGRVEPKLRKFGSRRGQSTYFYWMKDVIQTSAVSAEGPGHAQLG
jgi:hypothetical protein